VVPESDQHSDAHAKAVRAEFDERCREAGVAGRLAIEFGDVANRICERSAWVDMTVVRLSHPPRPQPWAKLNSGFHNLIRHCASPLLVTPRPTLARLGRAVVAYNGSPKADRALQIASYLARQWNIALAVVCVSAGGSDSPAILARARAEVEAHGLTATYHAETGPVAEIVLKQANDLGTDLIVMGGYGRGPFLETALGSTVDHVLRRSLIPMLICP
jgi:nucleotide-binding universal stress UspA family protein